jgi:hypothetical protein
MLPVDSKTGEKVPNEYEDKNNISLMLFDTRCRKSKKMAVQSKSVPEQV